MNTVRRPTIRVENLDPTVWDRPHMRAALAGRDIAALFRTLQRLGVSQRNIAFSTDQSQSEISEIIAGRQVMAVEVLERIFDNLGVPRGWVGLAYDQETAARFGYLRWAAGPAASDQIPPDDLPAVKG